MPAPSRQKPTWAVFEPRVAKTKTKGVIPMQCTLMHKNIKVAEMELDETSAYILKIMKVYNPEHLPLGIPFVNGAADRRVMNLWWTSRLIPKRRLGVSDAIEKLGIRNIGGLLFRSFALSLSDQYWIRPQNTDITWEKVNFFDNGFSEDIGDVLFGQEKKLDGFDYSSPDITTDGYQKKRWKIIDGKHCLIKGGSNLERQQPFNEVIATMIMERLDIPHVKYKLMWDGGEPYSVCENFVNSDAELVTAWYIMQLRSQRNSTLFYHHFVNGCEALGAKDIVSAIDRMLVLDFIIANEDRHFFNFGVLRNAETLEYIGFAPIYDNGNSLGYSQRVSQIRQQSDIVCKPFKMECNEQLKLVSDFSWIDFGKLADIPTEIVNFLSDEKAKEFISEQRAMAIAEAVRKRIEVLQEIALSHSSGETIDKYFEEKKGITMNEYTRLESQAEKHREQYPPGTRLCLIRMNDPYAPVPSGTRGTVEYVDDMDNIHMRWDNNRSLAIVPDEDSFRKLTDEELAEEELAKWEEESGEDEGMTMGGM